ncbi:MAG: cation transporter [Thermoanaerobaculia bacterium]|nr:cation transporter [Thermoanaerobaculia bacterium]
MNPVPATGIQERSLRKRRLAAALGVTLAALVLELAGGFYSRSLALLADATHLFADIAALILAYAAMNLADRAPTGKHTFGFSRAEVLAAFVNAQLLLVLALYILWEAIQRLGEPVPVRTGVMLGVALAGLIANLIAMRLLAPVRGKNLNMRAAYLEVVMDTLGSIAVVIAALAIPRTGWRWLDPGVSGAIAVLILPRAVSLLKQSAHILLEGAPGEVDLAALRRRILEVPGVEEMHDVHFWTLTSGVHSASLHIRAAGDSARLQVLQAVQSVLREEAGVDHATIQVEWGAETACRSYPEHA